MIAFVYVMGTAGTLMWLARLVAPSIKGNAYRSRTEAFLEWAEENPGEVWALREQAAAKELGRLLQQERRAAGASRRRPSLAEVPF